MSVNETRSMNQDLVQGKADGVRKALTPDRGGELDLTNVTQRAEELPWHYGVDPSGFPVKVSGKAEAGDCSCQH